MISNVEYFADRSFSEGLSLYYLQAPPDFPVTPTLPVIRTSSAGKPILPEFTSAKSKMASKVDNGLSIAFDHPSSDSEEEAPTLATISEEAPPAPPPPATPTSRVVELVRALSDGSNHRDILASEVQPNGLELASEDVEKETEDSAVSAVETSEDVKKETEDRSTTSAISKNSALEDAISLVSTPAHPNGVEGGKIFDIPEIISSRNPEEEGEDPVVYGTGNNTKESLGIVERSSTPESDNEAYTGVIQDALLAQKFLTIINETETLTGRSTPSTGSSHPPSPLIPNSISCPGLLVEGTTSLSPTPSSTRGKNQVMEVAFNFDNRDSDLEGSDLEEPELVEEDELETQMYGLSPSSSIESLPDLSDVVPVTSTSNLSATQSPGVSVEQAEGKPVQKENWVGIQKTTFTNWINNCLKAGKADRIVEDLGTDLRDGILLIRLLENLTKTKVKGFSGKDPKTEHHKRENLTLAFRFMRAESIKMIGVGPTNVYEGNMKLTLGMIWMLIQQYQIRVVGYNISTKDAILQWLEALLPTWKFTNLTSEWRDGRALIAVINQVKHGVAPNVSSLDPTKHRKNCTQALKAAYNHLRVPKIFTVDDLCNGKVDEESMMTYLSYFVPPYRAKLLRWVRKVIPQFGITGFTSDWYNGQAYAAVIDVCFPGSVRYWPTPDSEQFIETMLRFARRNLGSAPPFTSTDLTSGKVEEMQIMSMVMMIKNGELNTLAEEVRVSGPGLKEAQLHKETSFIVNTAGAGPGELSIDAYYEKDGERLKFSAKEKAKSEIHLKYTPKRLVNIVFAITWSDTPVPFSPFIVTVFDSTLVQVEDFDSHKRVVGVDEPIELTVDASRAGRGRLSAHLVYNKKDKIEAMVTPISKGRYRVDYTPLKPGSAALHIWWNKARLDHYQIMYTVISREDYAIDTCPNDKVFCTFEDVGFVVSSSLGLPLTVLQMTAIIDYEFQLPIHLSRVEGKKGYVRFKPTSPGIYNIEVVCLDRFIRGSPFQVRVMDPLSFKIKEDLPSFLKLGVPLMLEIDAKDASAETMAFASPDIDTSSKFRSKIRQNGANFVKAEITPLHEGDFIVGFKYHGHWISGCPFRTQICDPTKFRIVNDLRVANAGKPINLTVQARDVNEGDMNLVITAKGPKALYSPRVTFSEDTLQYNVTFIPWEIGDHKISVCYGNFHIKESPITIPVIALDPNTCSATGPGLQRAYTKVPAQFTILGKGTGWVDNGTLFIRIVSVVTKEECKVRIRDKKDGTYNVAYLVENPGAYLLEIKTAGDHIPGSPFRLNALPGPEPSKVKMFGPSLEENAVLTFGKPITFTVNTKEAGNGKLSVKAVGPQNANARIFIAKSDKDGEYEIDIDALRHGKHRVNVKWSGKHVPNSPFILKLFPGADASKCIAKGPGLEDGMIGKKTSFTIDTKLAGAGLLKVRLHGRKGAFKIQIQPVDESNRRVLLANYDPKFPGEYLIKIMWCDVHIPGSPFRVKISGDGRAPAALPEIYTPTPRLPELDSSVNLLGDIDDDDSNGSDNPLRASLNSAPNVLILDQRIKKDAMKSSIIKSTARRSMRVPAKKKKEFEGQLTVRMKGKTKSKFAK